MIDGPARLAFVSVAVCVGVVVAWAAVSAAGQESAWVGMTIDAEAMAAGVVPDHYVVREVTSDSRLGTLDSSVPGVALPLAASRDIAGGMTLDGARYRVVRVSSPEQAAALHNAAATRHGLSVSPVRVGWSTGLAGPPQVLPNDPLVDDQYSILNSGQSVGGVPGVAGADVQIARAWSVQRGSAQVRVAVIDSGVSATHPDLVTKLDDGVNITGGDPADTDATLNSHGTHIAGIVAAATNNGEGVVGVSWGSRIVPVKAANPLGFTSDVWLAEGLIWAAENGVDVAVMSFGLATQSDVLADAVRYAYDRGVVVVASAGNSGLPGVLYPAAYPEVIAVGATDNSDSLAAFSNTGPEVELVAPGVDILSTWHTMFEPNTYAYESGTSVSTPIVAGVVALLRSAAPEISPDAVRLILAQTSRDLGNPGRDVEFGFGRVNAHRALLEVTGQPWCYADVNGDGIVLPSDYSAWAAIFPDEDPRADQNRNGLIEPSDVNAFVANYTRSVGECWSD